MPISLDPTTVSSVSPQQSLRSARTASPPSYVPPLPPSKSPEPIIVVEPAASEGSELPLDEEVKKEQSGEEVDMQGIEREDLRVGRNVDMVTGPSRAIEESGPAMSRSSPSSSRPTSVSSRASPIRIEPNHV